MLFVVLLVIFTACQDVETTVESTTAIMATESTIISSSVEPPIEKSYTFKSYNDLQAAILGERSQEFQDR